MSPKNQNGLCFEERHTWTRNGLNKGQWVLSIY